jgi:hypothetical protein
MCLAKTAPFFGAAEASHLPYGRGRHTRICPRENGTQWPSPVKKMSCASDDATYDFFDLSSDNSTWAKFST